MLLLYAVDIAKRCFGFKNNMPKLVITFNHLVIVAGSKINISLMN